MKHHYKLIVRLALVSIALFATGKFLFSSIFGFFEPDIDGIFFQITDHGGKWQTSFLFSLLLALMPVIIILAWRFGPVLFVVQKDLFYYHYFDNNDGSRFYQAQGSQNIFQQGSAACSFSAKPPADAVPD